MEPKIITGGLDVDDRGQLSFINDFDFLNTNIRRFYVVENHKIGFIRAWHGHKKEGKYIFVSNGSALIGAVDMKTEKIYKFTLSSKQPKILFIPPNYFNGFKSLENQTKIMFFSTSTIDETKNDDIREKWDKWNIWEDNFR